MSRSVRTSALQPTTTGANRSEGENLQLILQSSEGKVLEKECRGRSARGGAKKCGEEGRTKKGKMGEERRRNLEDVFFTSESKNSPTSRLPPLNLFNILFV